MKQLTTITTALKPDRVLLKDLIVNKSYHVLTELNELSEFKYIGSNSIVLPCNTKTFLIDTDEVFIV